MIEDRLRLLDHGRGTVIDRRESVYRDVACHTVLEDTAQRMAAAVAAMRYDGKALLCIVGGILIRVADDRDSMLRRAGRAMHTAKRDKTRKVVIE